jgi:serine/threonine-protein kinase
MHETTSAVALSIRSLCLTAAWLVICAGATPSASAQSSSSDKALAESLFDRGLELMKLGKDEEACQTLERSQAVEPGVGTMLYLAECYEKLGRTASAWAMYREAASLAQEQGQSERAKKGATRAEHLQATLSKLTLVPPSSVTIPGLLITRNGNVVPAAALGVPVPVDPGEQKLTAAAPGYIPWNMSVDLPANGARLVVDVPALQPLPPSEQPPQPLVAQSEPTPSAASSAQLAPSAATEDQARSSFHKPLAYVLGGVGIVTLGVGGYFGMRAISENNKADEACPSGRCNGQGIDHDESARSAATASNVLVASGLALVAAGVVIYLVRPREDNLEVALSPGPGSAQLTLRGNF